MTRVLAILVAFAAVFVFTESASALSCQRRIISRGDSQAKVQRLCGQPAMRNQRVVENTLAAVTPVNTQGTQLVQATSVSVLVERWTYDFGPRRLMHELIFEDGILVRTRTNGYGSVAGNAAREQSLLARNDGQANKALPALAKFVRRRR